MERKCEMINKRRVVLYRVQSVMDIFEINFKWMTVQSEFWFIVSLIKLFKEIKNDLRNLIISLFFIFFLNYSIFSTFNLAKVQNKKKTNESGSALYVL